MSLRKYLNDYQTVTSIDENGQEKRSVVYRGPYFETSLDSDGLTRLRGRSFFLLGLILIFHIASGFLNNPGMYQFYVSLPFVIAFFPLVYLAAGILRLPREVRKYRRDEIGHSFNQIKSSSRILLVFLGIGILGEILFLVIPSLNAQLASEIIYIGLETAAMIGVFLLTRFFQKVSIELCSDPGTGS